MDPELVGVSESLLIEDPIHVIDGVFHVMLGGTNLPIMLGEKPLEGFNPGWSAIRLFTGFAPLFLLELQHEHGHQATWYLDYRLHHMGDDVRQLSPELQDLLRLSAVPLLRCLMDELLYRVEPKLRPEVEAFTKINRDTRDRIAAFCCGIVIPSPATYLAEHLQSRSLIFWTEARQLCAARREYVAAGLAMEWRDCIAEASRQGFMTWPSPVDGEPVRAQGCLIIDDFYFAVRFADKRNRLVFFVLVGEHNSRVGGVWYPSMGIVVSRDEYHRSLARLMIQNIPHWFLTHAVRWADMLIPYLLRGATRFASVLRGRPGVHIGHQLWNELSGIDTMVRCHPDASLQYLVLGAETGIELYGPVDELFPEIRGKVDRTLKDIPSMIASAYATDAIILRVTSDYVTEDLRRRILSYNGRGMVRKKIQHTLSRLGSGPVYLIGLRVENRTLRNFPAFIIRLIRAVAEIQPNAIFVFDGHNSRNDAAESAAIESHGERLAAEEPSIVENRLVSQVRAACPDHAHRILDTINQPMACSLLWANTCECFISIWGASLAKYRWVANKPGLVLSSGYNLRQRIDLRIYDAEDFMEKPTELAFIDPQLVTDRPEAPQLVPVAPGQPSFFNFDIEEEAVIERFISFVGLIRRELPPAINTQKAT